MKIPDTIMQVYCPRCGLVVRTFWGGDPIREYCYQCDHAVERVKYVRDKL